MRVLANPMVPVFGERIVKESGRLPVSFNSCIGFVREGPTLPSRGFRMQHEQRVPRCAETYHSSYCFPKRGLSVYSICEPIPAITRRYLVAAATR